MGDIGDQLIFRPLRLPLFVHQPADVLHQRLAVAKKGIYDGLAVVEQTPGSEISIEYNKIADMIIAEKFERTEKENG